MVRRLAGSLVAGAPDVATRARLWDPRRAMTRTGDDRGSAPGTGRVFGRRPHPALADRVASIAVIESAGESVTVLPSAGAVLGFQYRGRVRAEEGALSPAGVTGVQTAARRYAYDGPTGSVLVYLTAQGAACFGAPAHTLSRRSVPLDALVAPALVREALDRLADARDDGARVAVVEDTLRSLPYERDALVARALELLDAAGAGEARSVAAVARRLSISERQLERRFLARVGVSPRAYASLRRFERAVALAKTAPSLTRAALDAGYYDQAHFNREVRRFTGQTPKAALR